MNFVYMAVYLYIAYYTISYAMKVKREGNKLGAVIISMLSVAVIVAPAVVFFFMK